MKALISPNEVFTWSWVSAWQQTGSTWAPVYSQIENCQRVAEVEPDNKIFEVAQPLHWVNCPDNCVMDEWYYKDGQCEKKPIDVPMPTAPIVEMP
jgi:hypothetical protein